MAYSIDWNKWNSKFFKPENGKKHILKLADWKEEKKFDRDCIEFQVKEIDGSACDKTYTLGSFQAVQQLKPLMCEAEDKGKKEVTVSLTRTGEGRDTKYAIEGAEGVKSGQQNL